VNFLPIVCLSLFLIVCYYYFFLSFFAVVEGVIALIRQRHALACSLEYIMLTRLTDLDSISKYEKKTNFFQNFKTGLSNEISFS